jgi:UDP-galactopyranose mutase
MTLQYTTQLNPLATVYDCIQDIAASPANANAVRQYESLLFEKADVVFTAGHHLFESRRELHRNIYSFPNSIDKSHFTPARLTMNEPADQLAIPHPRIGFYGVLDERLNTSLLSDLADKHPEWQFILIGPVTGSIQELLPKQPNVHLLGQKEYSELPEYLSGWDAAMIPFALNESTRYINPAITPEFLAAGKPVVATAVYDIVYPYGKKGLVQIAVTAADFGKAMEKALQIKNDARWLNKVDRFLSNISWDKTFRQMEILTEATMERKRNMFRPLKRQVYA